MTASCCKRRCCTSLLLAAVEFVKSALTTQGGGVPQRVGAFPLDVGAAVVIVGCSAHGSSLLEDACS